MKPNILLCTCLTFFAVLIIEGVWWFSKWQVDRMWKRAEDSIKK